MLISIVIPVYNIKEYLPRCVKSICNQTYQQLEIILVDDGSTDGTSQLCDELAKEDHRIVVHHKQNGGTSTARNKGIELSKGKYIGFIDSDDYITPTMYEELLEALLRTNSDIAQIGRDERDEKHQPMPSFCQLPLTEVLYSSKEFVKSLLLFEGDASFCTKLMKKELFDNKKFPEGVLNEDFHLLMELLVKPRTIVSIPKIGYHVFCRLNSNTRKKDKNEFSRVFQDNVDNAFFALELVSTHYKQFVPIAISFGFIQRLDYMLHIPISQMKRSNQGYVQIVTYLRKHLFIMLFHKQLTKKQKNYLLLLTLAPKSVRKAHAFCRRKRISEQ